MSEEPFTAAPARPQFKKVTKKVKTRLRSREHDDDDEDLSAMQTIEATRKKRKLLNEVLYKKGLDVTLQAPSETVVAAAVETTTPQKDLDVRMRSFAGGGGDATAEGGVLQRKHQSAMEEFIQGKLKHSQEKQPHEDSTTTANKNDTDKLYAELASAAQKLAGIASSATTTGEADVGAGGAMLGGTGIAEVTLPADDRILNIKATEEAISAFPTSASKQSSAVPQDLLGSTSGKDDILNVPSSYSHNFQLHTQEWVQQKKQEEKAMEPVPVIQQDDSGEERVGFEAARRTVRGDLTTSVSRTQEKRRSNDDRAWKNFMTRQQQSRDR